MFLVFLPIFCLLSLCAAKAPDIVWSAAGGNYTKSEVTIHIIDGNVTGYYYATEMFFANGQVGYLGWQPRGGQYQQHLTFSAFGSGPYSDDTDRCSGGADGGSGVSCASSYPWKFGQNYTITMERTSNNPEDGSNTWTGSIRDDVTGESTYIARYTTPESYGLLKGVSLSFDEYYKANGMTDPVEDRDCYPESKYVQFAPVLYKDDGNPHISLFLYFGDFTKITDKCSSEANEANISMEKLNNTAVLFHYGILNN